MADDSWFTDTNLLLYSFDPRDTLKRSLANKWLDYLWRTGQGRLSWQVLHEFYANAVRKAGVTAPEAREAVMIFGQWQPIGMNSVIVEKAWYWMDNAQVSYWDGLILASANRLGCRFLLSEDFQAGRNYDGVTVVNPFVQLPPASGEHAGGK